VYRPSYLRTGNALPGSRTNSIYWQLVSYVADASYVQERDDQEWLGSHPAGFGALSLPSEGVRYGVNLTRIDKITAHLRDDDLVEFTSDLALWWHYSSRRLWLDIMPMDLIVRTFVQDRPFTAATLIAVANHHGFGLDEFFVR
jgi:hypothetical protein